MVTDRVYVTLQAENAALRQQLAAAMRRISELEAPDSGAPATPRKANRTTPRPTSNGTPIAIPRRELKRHTQPRRAGGVVVVDIPVTPRKKRVTQPRGVIAPAAPENAPVEAPREAGAVEPAAEESQAVTIISAAEVETPSETPAVSVAQTPSETPAHTNATLRNATHNTLLLLVGQLITWGSTLILAAAYGRFLGALGFGELYLATTFMALVGFPIEFSFNQQIVRDVAQNRDATQSYMTVGLLLKAALWVLLFIFSIALTYALGYSTEQRFLIIIFGLMLVSTAVSTTLISIQTAHMDVGLAKFGVVLEKGLDCILVVALLRSGFDVEAAAWALLFGSVAGMSWQIYRTVRKFGIHPTWDSKVAKSLIRAGVSFLAYGVIGVIYYRIDTVMLSVYATATAVGVYGAAYRLFDTLMFVPSIVIGGVVSPILAKHSVDSDSKLRLTVEKSTIAMLLCSGPAAAGLLVASPNIIAFVYHRSDFNGSVAILQILAVGLIALYLNTVLTTVLVSTGQERKMPVMALIALVFNVGINLYLIPRFMDVGAAWATSLTEILLLGIGVAMIDRSLIPARLWKGAGKILIACVVMAIVAKLLATFSIFLIIGASAVTYFAMVAWLRVLPAEDTAALKGVAARFIPGRVKRLAARVLPGRFSRPALALLKPVADNQPQSAVEAQAALDPDKVIADVAEELELQAVS